MRYHFFLHYGWFPQNLGKDFIRTNMHTTVTSAEAETEYFFTQDFFQGSAVQASAKVEKKGKQKIS